MGVFYVKMAVEARVQTQVSFRTPTLFFETGTPMVWSSTICQGWQVSHTWVCLYNTGIANLCHHTQAFRVGSKDQPQALVLAKPAMESLSHLPSLRMLILMSFPSVSQVTESLWLHCVIDGILSFNLLFTNFFTVLPCFLCSTILPMFSIDYGAQTHVFPFSSSLLHKFVHKGRISEK